MYIFSSNSSTEWLLNLININVIRACQDNTEKWCCQTNHISGRELCG